MSGAEDRPLAVLAGPTASGKTSLALECRERFGCALISADAMQVYRGMDVGTAKPAPAQRGHFSLIDVADPGSGFSAGQWAGLAAREAGAAWKEGRLPLLCGGSGLYLRAFVKGLPQIPPIPAELRARCSKLSKEALWARLESADPAFAAGLDAGNPRRLQRAVEVLEATGKSLGWWQEQASSPAAPFTRLLFLVLDPGREALARAIEARCGEMVGQAWLDEAVRLKAKWGEEKLLGCGAIGYPEMLEVAAGSMSLGQAREKILHQTRQYARRQRTWFRREPDAPWVDPAALHGKMEAFIKGSG